MEDRYVQGEWSVAVAVAMPSPVLEPIRARSRRVRARPQQRCQADPYDAEVPL